MLVLADLRRIKIPGMISSLLISLLLLCLFLSLSLNSQCPIFQSLLKYLLLCLILTFLSPFNILFQTKTDQSKSSLELYNTCPSVHIRPSVLNYFTTLF